MHKNLVYFSDRPPLSVGMSVCWSQSPTLWSRLKYFLSCCRDCDFTQIIMVPSGWILRTCTSSRWKLDKIPVQQQDAVLSERTSCGSDVKLRSLLVVDHMALSAKSRGFLRVLAKYPTWPPDHPPVCLAQFFPPPPLPQADVWWAVWSRWVRHISGGWGEFRITLKRYINVIHHRHHWLFLYTMRLAFLVLSGLSTTTGWNIPASLRMNCNNSGDLQAFHSAPSSVQNSRPHSWRECSY